MSNKTKKPEIINLKNLLRLLSLIIVYFFFVPVFLVSCSGQKVNVSGVRVATGDYQSIVGATSSHFLAFFLLLIPIGIIVVWTIRNLKDDKKAIISAHLATIDIIAWMLFKMRIKSFASNNYLTFKTTAGYRLNQFVLLIVLIFSTLIALKILRAEMPLRELAADIGRKLQDILLKYQSHGENINPKPKQANSYYTENKQDEVTRPPKFCGNCGSPIAPGDKFCNHCGKKI